ncbi:MAG: PHP domain-containing protein [Selenomonadales bacterium]|nr:PHP domain-containing protein [Selenomonadales bacterium]
MRIADLHIHTTASDGIYSPQEIVEQAIAVGLSTIAITDHDTVGGIMSLDIATEKRINIISGIEFSCNCMGEEIHILGYLRDAHHHELHAMLDKISVLRRERLLKMLARLNERGYAITMEDLIQATGLALSWGRPHLAKILIKKGYFSTVGEVFEKLLYSGGPVFIPRAKPEYTEVIELMRQIGGISILAHPGIIKNAECITAVLDAGIDGIEVYHPKNDLACRRELLTVAEARKCLVTGGSDFHGMKGRFPEKLGIWNTDTAYADALMDALKEQRR